MIIYASTEIVAAWMDERYAEAEGQARAEVIRELNVKIAFVRLLARAPDARELAAAKHLLERGVPLENVVKNLALQHPHVDVLAHKLFVQHLGRKATDRELLAIRTRLAHSEFIEQIERDLVAIRNAHVLNLARLPRDSEIVSWFEFQDGLRDLRYTEVEGKAREAMSEGLAHSLEARELLGKIYQQHLGRAPTQAEVQAAQKRLTSGAGISDIEVEIANSVKP